MRLIDHVYANTLIAIANDIMKQIGDSEAFVNDNSYEDDDYKQSVRDDIPKMVAMLAPVLINMNHAFKWSITPERKEFIEKYNIQITEENAEVYDPVEELRSCIEEAPLDFLGTGSNSKEADKDEIEWHARVEKALKEIEKHI
jgi:hypothetical protein